HPRLPNNARTPGRCEILILSIGAILIGNVPSKKAQGSAEIRAVLRGNNVANIAGIVARWDKAQRYTLVSNPAVAATHLVDDPLRLDDVTPDMYDAVLERLVQRADKCFASTDEQDKREGFLWHRAKELLETWAAHAEAYE